MTKALTSAALNVSFCRAHHIIIIIINTSFFPLPLTEQDQYDVREDVTSTETLLQIEHYQERAWTKTFIQVYQLKRHL